MFHFSLITGAKILFIFKFQDYGNNRGSITGTLEARLREHSLQRFAIIPLQKKTPPSVCKLKIFMYICRHVSTR
jgi:hypothetical protein